MQEFQSIPGVPDCIFPGGGGGGGSGGEDLRRLTGFPPAAAGGQQGPVKCPRCDSTNTKFCYYNNYNLSQPRHFCKSCRRYWTKGGVLRNVPVGGGCRKAKRSSSSASASSSKNSKSSSSAAGEKDGRRPAPASRSSSESSGLSGAADVSSSASAVFPSSGNPNADPSLDPPPPATSEAAGQEPEIFPPAAGSFTNLMGASAAAGPAGLGFGFADPPPFTMPAQQSPAPAPAVGEAEKVKIPAPGGILEQTVPDDLRPFNPRSSCGGINGLDWPGSMDPALFDLTGAVDPGAYWSQTQWGDADPSLYLP